MAARGEMPGKADLRRLSDSVLVRWRQSPSCSPAPSPVQPATVGASVLWNVRMNDSPPSFALFVVALYRRGAQRACR